VRRTSKFGLVAASIAAVTLLGVSACSSGGGAPAPDESESAGLPTSFTEDLVDQAKAEGELVIYMDGDERSVQNWAAAFTEKYGIAVTTSRKGSAEQSQTVNQEFAAGQHLHDITITTDVLALADWAQSGVLAEYVPTDVDLWPSNLGEAGLYYPFQNTSVQTVAWNTENVTPDEQAALIQDPLEAMMDPAFKGRVGIINPTSATRMSTWYNYTDGPNKNLYGGWGLVESIAANEPIVYGDVIALIQGLTIGEVDAVYGGVPDGYVAINVASGAPLADSYPSHPAAITGYTSIMSDAPHPYAARLFQEWAATPESAALFSETSSTYPLNSEVEDQRAVTKEPWYTPVSTVLDDLWVDWALDSDFVAATQPNSPWITKFNTIMGITN